MSTLTKEEFEDAVDRYNYNLPIPTEVMLLIFGIVEKSFDEPVVADKPKRANKTPVDKE
jgi:hypothetical protein